MLFRSLEKDSYCTVPKSHSDFKKINGKDYRVDVEFEKCVFDSETYENVKVGVLIQDVEKTEKYLKKYKYMHLKAGKNLVYNASPTSDSLGSNTTFTFFVVKMTALAPLYSMSNILSPYFNILSTSTNTECLPLKISVTNLSRTLNR